MSKFLERLTHAFTGGPPPSKDEAKQRLKVLLIHDQVDLTPAQLDRMKDEILQVIRRYCEIGVNDDIEFNLNRDQASVVLRSTIPVRRITMRA